eukprot:403374981
MFNNIPNLIELSKVHNLIELTCKIIDCLNQNLVIGTLTTSLQGIESQEPYFLKLINLRHLNLGENQITNIQNLQNCIQLEKIFLYTNQIKKIQGLDNNLTLKELHLQGNLIKKVENISRLVSLEILLLSGNLIENFDGINSKEQENEHHLRQMQIEILSEIDNLKVEVSDGRNKIQDEIDRYRKIREDALESLRINFTQLKESLSNQIQKINIQNSEETAYYQLTCEREIKSLEFEKEINLGLIDVLYETQGQVIFNEIEAESLEFRVQRDLFEQSCSPDAMIINGGAYSNYIIQVEKQKQVSMQQNQQQIKKKKTGAQQIITETQEQIYNEVITIKKIFEIKETLKNMQKFTSNNRYYVRINDSNQLKLLLKGDLNQIFQPIERYNTRIHKQVNKCYAIDDQFNSTLAVAVIKLNNDLFQKTQNEIDLIQLVEQSQDSQQILVEQIYIFSVEKITIKQNFNMILEQSVPQKCLLQNLITPNNNAASSKLLSIYQQHEQEAMLQFMEMEKLVWQSLDGQQVLNYQSQLNFMKKYRGESFNLLNMIEDEKIKQEQICKELRSI